MSDANALQAESDERKIARVFTVVLPLVTFLGACAASVIFGAAAAILVLAGGGLLGVIALFWTSLRILSGDAALSPEIEALDATAHAVDALASRKKMLLRALKDLENEHALGKLDDEDFADISSTYRADIREVMARIDKSLEPHRSKVDLLVRKRMVAAGLAEAPYRGVEPAPEKSEKTLEATPDAKKDAPARVECAKCKESNEPDAKFCKGCGAVLADQKAATDEA